MTTQREVRALGRIEVRAAEEARKIVGYAAVFNSPTDIGGMFREQIAPGAFKDAIGRDDVRALIDHDSRLVLGRSTAGTLRMEEDERGLRVEIDPPDTQIARDLMISMERGDITQMSFGFIARKQEWDESGEIPLRTIQEADLFDVSVVTYPAYPDTSVAVRSLEGWRQEQKKPFDAGAIAARMRMKLSLPAHHRPR